MRATSSQMPRWWRGLMGRFVVARGLFRFLWQQRLWWMIPMVTILLLFGVLLLVAEHSVVAPFIYTLF